MYTKRKTKTRTMEYDHFVVAATHLEILTDRIDMRGILLKLKKVVCCHEDHHHVHTLRVVKKNRICCCLHDVSLSHCPCVH